MKKLKLLAVMFLLSMPLFGANGLTEGVQKEGSGVLLVIGLVFLAILLFMILGVPYAGYSYAQKATKKFIENDQDKNAGVKVQGAGVLGGLAGLYLVYAILGTVGSFMDSSMNGNVDFGKGTNYLASTYISPIVKKASGL